MEVTEPPRGSPGLRRVLILVDALAVAASWGPALYHDHIGAPSLLSLRSPVLAIAVAIGMSLGVIASQHLYRARTCGVAAVELTRLWKVALLCGIFDVVVDLFFGLQLSISRVVLRAVLTFVLLTVGRSGYRTWLKSQRRKGRFSRPVLIVGTNDEGLGLYRLLRDHPELGFRVCGLVGAGDPGLEDEEAPWLGGLAHLPVAVLKRQATGALVAATALEPAELNRVVRQLHRLRVHVHLSSGLKGIAYQRVSPTSLAHESLLYVEATKLTGWQMVAKQVLDVSLAFMALALSVPILALAALAIKRHDGGPVLFRQQRVGRRGNLFTIYKLRTMVPEAEARLSELLSLNQRDGPLFKVDQDPRVTPIGRLLRATSIDELPQLVNVLRGEMSLVGPRPALPSEAAEFDADLRGRQDVKPGISGLWQLEARDSASFEAYQRLDLFYVENWSVLLDLAILLSTIQSVAWRGLSIQRRSRRHGAARSVDGDGGLQAATLDTGSDHSSRECVAS